LEVAFRQLVDLNFATYLDRSARHRVTGKFPEQKQQLFNGQIQMLVHRWNKPLIVEDDGLNYNWFPRGSDDLVV
jgi:hypothetical protein